MLGSEWKAEITRFVFEFVFIRTQSLQSLRVNKHMNTIYNLKDCLRLTWKYLYNE